MCACVLVFVYEAWYDPTLRVLLLDSRACLCAPFFFSFFFLQVLFKDQHGVSSHPNQSFCSRTEETRKMRKTKRRKAGKQSGWGWAHRAKEKRGCEIFSKGCRVQKGRTWQIKRKKKKAMKVFDSKQRPVEGKCELWWSYWESTKSERKQASTRQEGERKTSGFPEFHQTQYKTFENHWLSKISSYFVEKRKKVNLLSSWNNASQTLRASNTTKHEINYTKWHEIPPAGMALTKKQNISIEMSLRILASVGHSHLYYHTIIFKIIKPEEINRKKN